MTEQIRAPWTPEQVAALNTFQRRGGMHPFTCGGDHAPGSPVLIAYADGWRCPQPYGEPCDYQQDWAHAFMAEPQRVTHSCRQEPHTWGCMTTVETDTITVDNPRNTGWYWTCTACNASVGKYSTDDQARAQAAIDHPQCPPDPNGPYAWTIPTATEATEPDDSGDTAALRDQLAAAIWERQNPGRRYIDCEHPWQADAEADADAVLAALTLRLDFGEEQAWCKTCRRAWHGTDHRCESDSEQQAAALREALTEVLACLYSLERVGGTVIGYQTVNVVPPASYDRWQAALNPPQEPTP
ncbi:hypothetical protein ACFXKI_09815 [Streptomyces mirabilis]|uniref:hypothetical protein n=1 Tax=Streptomyces mirabilis TaxID=68239 RepID=UPI0036909F12